ncbi:MAG: sulfatase-like hydrolase/transferase [Planctomycetota bacterium]
MFRSNLATRVVLISAITTFLSVCLSGAEEAKKKPNVLLILADDLGYSDLGCYGSEIETPQLDALAAGGLRFTQFYNTGRCWPTRGSLLTGYYAQQIRRDTLAGVPSGGGNRGRRPEWATLLPQLLRKSGYRSYHTGKWHLDGMPLENGFDRSYYLKDQGRFFSPTKHWLNDQPLPPVQRDSGFYATTSLADRAIADLKDHAENHSEKPFFHYLAFAAPHFPLHALPEDIARYQDRYGSGWDAIRGERWSRMRKMGLLSAETVARPSRPERDLGPPYHFPKAFEALGEGEINRPIPWRELTEAQRTFQATKMSLHAAMIHRMDIEIGRVLDQIKSMGCWDDTLVLFLSDNGASAEIMVRDDGHDPEATPGSASTYLCLGPGWSTVCNTPFRRHKTWTHEGGIATPMIAHWPNGISAKGEFSREPQHVIDVSETLLQLANVDREPDVPPSPGKSFARQLGSNDQANTGRMLWWYHDEHRAIRVGDWKAVAPIGEPWELYDLANDRAESVDLAVPRSDKLAELVTAWETQLLETIELATRDLDKSVLDRAKRALNAETKFRSAQEEARPKRRQVLINAENMRIADRHAFLMKPDQAAETENGKPWIFYGPTLPGVPDRHESWMHERFLAAGVAVAGIDVGEAYGSPHSQRFFDALYAEMVSRGYSRKPALLGRSRGGLYVSRFAIERPQRVAGVGCIYPVFDYRSYPGVQRAAAAYGVSPEDLTNRSAEFNPIERSSIMVEADIPVFIIHGMNDTLVPIEPNSMALEARYHAAGKDDLITVQRIEGQGHNFWPGFFQCQELVDFLIARAKGD